LIPGPVFAYLFSVNLFLLLTAHAQSAFLDPDEEIPPLIPWLKFNRDAPPSLLLKTDVTFDPQSGNTILNSCSWETGNTSLKLFDGTLQVHSHGCIRPIPMDDRPATITLQSFDITTSTTLKSVDVRKIMTVLDLPHADEIMALLSGHLQVRFHNGDWQNLDLELYGDPGTVFIGRKLIHTLLTNQLTTILKPEQIDAVLDEKYENRSMIPLEDMVLKGRLEGEKLLMSIPLHNPALKIDIDPRIDRSFIWDAWDLVREKGFPEGQWTIRFRK
jgi:hypothetical protein